MQRDLVCGETLTDADVRGVDTGASPRATKRWHRGRWWYFCGLWCRARFVAAPQAYLPPDPKQG